MNGVACAPWALRSRRPRSPLRPSSGRAGRSRSRGRSSVLWAAALMEHAHAGSALPIATGPASPRRHRVREGGCDTREPSFSCLERCVQMWGVGGASTGSDAVGALGARTQWCLAGRAARAGRVTQPESGAGVARGTHRVPSMQVLTGTCRLWEAQSPRRRETARGTWKCLWTPWPSVSRGRRPHEKVSAGL